MIMMMMKRTAVDDNKSGTDGRTDERTEGRTDGQTDRQTDWQTSTTLMMTMNSGGGQQL